MMLKTRALEELANVDRFAGSYFRAVRDTARHDNQDNGAPGVHNLHSVTVGYRIATLETPQRACLPDERS